ncbi:hypothetical protein [Nonomuraea jabiensis]|uniref:hypothetical protein n=1 Tax=Nonomuraea jabiensis TaxID=882448 RepID=UPI00368BA169
MRNQMVEAALVLITMVMAAACGSGPSTGTPLGASHGAETAGSSAASPGVSPSPLKTVTLPAPACNGNIYAPESFKQTTLDLDAGTVNTRDVPAPAGNGGRNPFSADKATPSTPANRWIEYYVANCVVDRLVVASNMFDSASEVQRQPADLNACEEARNGRSVGDDRAELDVGLLTGKQFCVVRTDGAKQEGLYFSVELQQSPPATLTITYAIY